MIEHPNTKRWIIARRAKFSRKQCRLPSFVVREKPLALSTKRRQNEALT